MRRDRLDVFFLSKKNSSYIVYHNIWMCTYNRVFGNETELLRVPHLKILDFYWNREHFGTMKEDFRTPWVLRITKKTDHQLEWLQWSLSKPVGMVAIKNRLKPISSTDRNFRLPHLGRTIPLPSWNASGRTHDVPGKGSITALDDLFKVTGVKV